MSQEQMDALAGDPRASGLFSERELAIIDWAESVALNSARRNRAAFETLRSHFSDAEIVELTVVVAHRTMINRIQEALWTDLEGPEVPKNTRAEMSDDVLRAYVGEVLGQQIGPAGILQGSGDDEA